MTTLDLDCSDCSRDWSLEGDAVVDRLEITTVYTPAGCYRAAVCTWCGGLLEPYLEEVPCDA